MTNHPQPPIKRKPLGEYLRFGVVGVLNTGVDFIVLNALLLALGAYAATHFAEMKAISFVAAVVNSYLLNRYWVFGSKAAHAGEVAREGGKFLVVSVAGFLLNVASSSFVFTLLLELGIFDHRLAANVSAMFGTLVVLFWNFAGYKFFVFRPQTQEVKTVS